MSNREKARALREEMSSSKVGGAEVQAEKIEELRAQIEELQEKFAQLQIINESLVESIASLEGENLELKRAMETQSASLSS